MIILKNKSELEIMRIAGQISAQALALGGEMVKPGVTTGQIDLALTKFIRSQNSTPSFMDNGFPASACISVNDEVIHGVPGNREILPGDIVSIDVGACYKGFHGDNAATFAAGEISDEVRLLLEHTRESLYKGIEQAVPDARVGDISHAVQTHAEQFGYGVVREYIGHGVGRNLHESPEIPNYGKPGRGPRLAAGMVMAIEPMINLHAKEVKTRSDGHTVVTVDGHPSAHFEHTIAITENGPVILTQV